MEYSNNSIKMKSKTLPEKKAKGDVSFKSEKKGIFLSIINFFLGDDIDSIKDYLLEGVFKPSVKRFISESVNGILYKDKTGRVADRTPTSKIGYTAYSRSSNGIYERQDRNVEQKEEVNKRIPGNKYEDLEFDMQSDIDDIIESLNEIIDKTDYASVADLYALAGVKNYPTTLNKYGWVTTKGYKIIPYNGRFLLKMPSVRSVPIED